MKNRGPLTRAIVLLFVPLRRNGFPVRQPGRLKAPRTVTSCKTIFVAAALTVLAGVSAAQSVRTGPGVARLSFIQGEVSVLRGEASVAGDLNMPLVEGDAVATAAGARAEIQLSPANYLRLDENTRVEVVQLGRRRFRVRLAQGTATYSELMAREAQMSVETPRVNVRPRSQGRYELNVTPSETRITVHRGGAEVASPEGSEGLREGSAMIIREDEQGPLFRIVDSEPPDAWERWNANRDERICRQAGRAVL